MAPNLPHPILWTQCPAADYDNDGDLDVAINTIAGQPALLRNEGTHGNWLQVELADPMPGTRVTVTLPDGRKLVREVHAGSSYLSSEDPRPHFGLGSVETVPSVVVRWPGGNSAELTDVPANQRVSVAPPE